MNKIILLITALIISGHNLYAQSIDTNQEMMQHAKNILDKSKSMEIPEHIKKSAESAFDTIFNGEVSNQIDKYKNTMTFDPETGIIKFSNNPYNNSKTDDKIQIAKNGIFNHQVSLSQYWIIIKHILKPKV